MGEIRRLSLSLFLSSPLQREAWELLQSLPPGKRTEYVCRAVCRMRDQTYVLDAVRAVMRENAAVKPQRYPEEENVQSVQAGDVGQDVLGFLRELQEGGEAT